MDREERRNLGMKMRRGGAVALLLALAAAGVCFCALAGLALGSIWDSGLGEIVASDLASALLCGGLAGLFGGAALSAALWAVRARRLYKWAARLALVSLVPAAAGLFSFGLGGASLGEVSPASLLAILVPVFLLSAAPLALGEAAFVKGRLEYNLYAGGVGKTCSIVARAVGYSAACLALLLPFLGSGLGDIPAWWLAASLLLGSAAQAGAAALILLGAFERLRPRHFTGAVGLALFGVALLVLYAPAPLASVPLGALALGALSGGAACALASFALETRTCRDGHRGYPDALSCAIGRK
jgi:hypothetical protein